MTLEERITRIEQYIVAASRQDGWLAILEEIRASLDAPRAEAEPAPAERTVEEAVRDDIRGRAFEFARKNADNWSADDIDNLASLLASERAAAEDRVQARTQNEIVATLAALVGPDNVASGDGCDSGDALDWTVACVSLTIRKILDRHEEALLSERAAALGAAGAECDAERDVYDDDPTQKGLGRRVSAATCANRIRSLSPEGWVAVRAEDLAVLKQAARVALVIFENSVTGVDGTEIGTPRAAIERMP